MRFEFHILSFPMDVQRAILKSQKTTFKPCSTLPENQASINTPSTPQADESTRAEVAWNNFARVGDGIKQRTRERLEAVQAVEDLIAAGVKKSTAKKQIADLHGVSVWALSDWIRKVAKHHTTDRLPALLPGYVGCTPYREISPGAWDFFLGDYLRLERPAASACYERLLRVAPAKDWTIPSLKTFLRKLRREIPPRAIISARQGERALECSLPAQKRDHGVFSALEAVNADGHRFDVFARFPDGTIDRPVGLFWQCIYSGKVLSWRIDRTENAHITILSFGDLVERFGVPSSAFLDNGRSFASKWLTGGIPNRYRFKIKPEDPAGILKQLGVEVHWCRPYHGQSKPIERAFRDLCEYVSKHPAFAGAYCGNKPDAKPEGYGSRAVPLNEFIRILGEEITAHNAREGRRSAVCRGRSFDEVFQESYASTPVRKVSESQRHLWLLAAEGLNVSPVDGGVSLAGNRYQHPALARFMGRKVVCRFDPQRLQKSIFVFTLAGEFISKADCIHAVGFADMAAAKEHARQHRRAKKHEKASLEAQRKMRALDVARMLPRPPEPDEPEAKTIQPIFKRAAGHDTERAEAAFEAAVKDMRRAFK